MVTKLIIEQHGDCFLVNFHIGVTCHGCFAPLKEILFRMKDLVAFWENESLRLKKDNSSFSQLIDKDLQMQIKDYQSVIQKLETM